MPSTPAEDPAEHVPPAPPPPVSRTGVRLARFHGVRHALVLGGLILLCGLLYGHVTDAPFHFDDEPNITKCPAVQMHTLSWRNLKKAAVQSKAPNRILVSVSFALQHWAAQFLPRLVDKEASKPALLAWQFRMVNFLMQIGAGFAVYLLLLHLLQLPRVEGYAARHAWPLAVLGTLVWFCSPVQVQSVTYIVQRAACMATGFYALGLVCYLRARAASTTGRQMLFVGLALLACACSVFSKEIGATFPIAAVLIELLLIREPRRSVVASFGILALSGLLALGGAIWFYGRTEERLPSGRTVTRLGLEEAVAGLRRDLFDRILADEVVSRKIKLTPRQRLLTETRVIALYQSLLVLPVPWRLNLDYDFLESRELFLPSEMDALSEVAPLLIVLGIPVLLLLVPPHLRARWFLVGLAAACVFTVGRHLLGGPDVRTDFLALDGVWRRPWPVPALTWHAIVLGFAALYSYRRPLLAFGLAFFYLGMVIESTVISLEVVYEHRLYLPSIGFYLALVLLTLEAFEPPREEDLGPRPFPRRGSQGTMPAGG